MKQLKQLAPPPFTLPTIAVCVLWLFPTVDCIHGGQMMESKKERGRELPKVVPSHVPEPQGSVQTE